MRRSALLGAATAVVLGVVGMASAVPAAQAQDAPSISIDVRVWQNVADELDIRIGARPSGSLWQTLGAIPLPLDDGLSNDGRHRYGDLEVDIPVQAGALPVTVEIRVWQHVRDSRSIYISARGSLGSWQTLGTVRLALDAGLSRDGRFRYSDIQIDAPLPQPAVTTLSAFGGDQGALAIDRDGSVVATNPGAGTVERISPDGRLTTIADRGFHEPRGVAIGRDGAIYVGDTHEVNGRRLGVVRKIAPDGTVTTVAGGVGTSGWSAARSPAAEARFSRPNALAVDRNGDVVILAYSAILRLAFASEDEVHILAGRTGGAIGIKDGPGPEALFGSLSDGAIDVDNAGNVYVLDPLRYSIESSATSALSRTAVRMIDARGVVSTPFQDLHPSFGGTLTTSRGGLAVTSDGAFVYIANTAQNQIVRITREGEIQAVAGTGEQGHTDGSCGEAQFDRPTALALSDDDRTLVVADQRGAYLRRIDLEQTAPCIGKLPLALPEPPPPKLAGVETRVVARFPRGIRLQVDTTFATGPENVHVGMHDGWLSHIVLSDDRPPVVIPIIGGDSGQDGPCETAQLHEYSYPDIAVGADGSIWFTNYKDWRIHVRRITWTVPAERTTGLDCQVTTVATFPAYSGREIALDDEGNVLFSSRGLYRISPDGAVQTLLTGNTRELAFANGNAYVIDWDVEANTLAIRRVDAAGRVSTIWEGPEERGGGLLSVQDIALVAAPDGTLYAWSGWDDRIVRIRPDGSASIVHDVTDDLGGPDVFIDLPPYIGADGELWINAWNGRTNSTEIHRFLFPDEAVTEAGGPPE